MRFLNMSGQMNGDSNRATPAHGDFVSDGLLARADRFLTQCGSVCLGALRFAAPRHGRVSATRIRACGGLGADGPHLMLVGQRL